jgi:hypothetical protein
MRTPDQSPQLILTNISGGGGSSIRAYKVRTIQKDYLVCRTWDSIFASGSFTYALGSTDVPIAKPYKLRGSVASATLDGVAVTYTYPNSLVEYTARDMAIAGLFIETQIILPRYLADPLVGKDVILATEPEGGTGLMTGAGINAVEITWADVNVDGRAWGRKYV